MKLLIIDHKARSTRGFSVSQAAKADVVVGRDRTVLKDRDGVTVRGRSLTVKELDALRDQAEEVIERGEPLV